jgi:hypothetical protein
LAYDDAFCPHNYMSETRLAIRRACPLDKAVIAFIRELGYVAQV